MRAGSAVSPSLWGVRGVDDARYGVSCPSLVRGMPAMGRTLDGQRVVPAPLTLTGRQRIRGFLRLRRRRSSDSRGRASARTESDHIGGAGGCSRSRSGPGRKECDVRLGIHRWCEPRKWRLSLGRWIPRVRTDIPAVIGNRRPPNIGLATRQNWVCGSFGNSPASENRSAHVESRIATQGTTVIPRSVRSAH
jgi:hypothetical protein